MISTLVCAFLVVTGAPSAPQDAAPPPGLTWGYVGSLDGLTLTLDSGVVVKLTDKTKIIGLDGREGTPEDIIRGLKAELTIDTDGTVSRLELLPAPLAPEYYLTTLTVRGATTVSAKMGERLYPRSLSALKASFTAVPNATAFVGGVAFLPKGGKPAAAKFSLVNAANDVLFERTLAAGQTTEFRLNFPAGQQPQTLTLLATPVGEGTLEPESCLWLDPKLMGPLPTTQEAGVYRSTVHTLLTELKQALGETNPGAIAVALFTAQRIRDDQILKDLQEDLVIAGTAMFQMVGKTGHRPELGMPLPEAVKKEAQQLGAKSLLVGSVSDRVDLLVINAALVEVESGTILATARAWQ
ncbi:MAG: hypothetical protein ACUVX8_13550 [Candidatus Zipacnadales bacterium]